jgi:DNA replication protein DnaC
METHQRIETLSKRLRLPDLAKYKEVVEPGAPFDSNLCAVLELAAYNRSEKSLARRLKIANLEPSLNYHALDLKHLPNLKQDQLNELLGCSFIREKEDLILCGPVGRGKSHLANALGIEAVREGYKVHFANSDRMLTSMIEAKTSKNLNEYVDNLCKYDLLIIDELGFTVYEPEKANMMFRVITERHRRASTIVTTNYKFTDWNKFIQDQALLMAMVDRLAYKSKVLNMDSESSYRLKDAKTRKNTPNSK